MIIDFKPKKASLHPIIFLYKAKIAIPAFFFFLITSYCFLDHPFAIFCSDLPQEIQKLLQFFTSLFHPLFCLVLFPSLFFFVKFIQKREKASRKLWFISLALAPPIFITNTIQTLLGRNTPEWFFSHGERSFKFLQASNAYSNSSTLSCAIGALFTAFACIYPNNAKKFLILGTTVGLLPAITTQCFFSDSLLGLGTGIILSSAVFKAMRRQISFFES